MKLKLLFLISSFAAFASTAFADTTIAIVADSVQTYNAVQRQEQRNEYHTLYSKMPSLLSGWSYADFSYIATEYTADGGKYHNPQLFGKHNFLEIRTESILTLPDTTWRFYGEFGYQNGLSEGGEWNLSYNQSETGSPYYFMLEKAGKWAFQTYEFNAGIVKTLPNDKISLGMGISYTGILDFRTVDTRNENYRLDLGLTPSVTLKLNPAQSASIGLVFGRKKMEPQIYNKYQHGAESEPYQLFFNEGLGTWDSNPSLINMTDNRYGASASWGYKTPKHIVNIIYEFAKGTEDWRLNSYSNQSTASNNVARYSYLSNSLTACYDRNLAKGSLHAELDASYISGKGSPYNLAADSYFKNYNSAMGQSNFAVSYQPLQGHFKSAGIGSQINSLRQKDINYEHTISYINQTSNAWVDFIFGDVRKGSLLVGLNGGYHSNLNILHSPKAAASNFYNTQIALPTLAYLTSSYFIAGAKLGSEFDINKEYHFEVTLNGEIYQPTKINYALSSAKFSTSDSFYNLKLSLLFNF
jgi:hypothetical protein